MNKYEPNYIPGDAQGFHDFAVYRDVRIPARDGVELSSNLYFPAVEGKVDFDKKYPVILIRTGYMGVNGEDWAFPQGMHFYVTELGFVYIISNCRGAWKSGGDQVHPLQDEGWGEHQDGVDVVNWIAEQPWCNGKIATVGMSWAGGTEYMLWLVDDVPESLVTSVIANPAVNSGFNGFVMKDGFYDQAACGFWCSSYMVDQVNGKRLPDDILEKISEDNQMMGDPFGNPMAAMALSWPHLQMEYGLENIPIIRYSPFYREWLAHREDPDFFAYNDTRPRSHAIDKPLLFVGSWFDVFNGNVLNGFERMVAEAPDPETAKGHRLVVGPWPHVGYVPMVRQYPEASLDMRMLQMEWIGQQVDGVKSAFFEENPVTLFVVGENKWRSEKEWPLSDAVSTKYYLHSMGPANTMMGFGSLSEQEPGADEAPDNYMYDPADPIIQAGGSTLLGGQVDQRQVEMRPDVLCYTTQVLEEDTEVTGYIRGMIYAATSAEDTDFFIKLIDVCPDGICYNVQTGGCRGRYLKNGIEDPSPLVPGEINEWPIELHAMSYVFKKGHRIRVEVCSSDAVNYDINPNAFIDLNKATKEDYVVAAQTVYHDAEHASYIELPVIPASHERNWIEDWPFDSAVTGFDYGMNGFTSFAGNEPVELDRADLPSTTKQPHWKKEEAQENKGAVKF